MAKPLEVEVKLFICNIGGGPGDYIVHDRNGKEYRIISDFPGRSTHSPAWPWPVVLTGRDFESGRLVEVQRYFPNPDRPGIMSTKLCIEV